MFINKFKAQKLSVIQKNQPDLYLFIITHFPKESIEIQGKIAGAIIEYVIQSHGDVEIFDDKPKSILEDDDFDNDPELN